MKKFTTLFLTSVIFFGLFVIHSPHVNATTCDSVTLEKAIRDADFVGVIEPQEMLYEGNSYYGYKSFMWKVKVIKTFKGKSEVQFRLEDVLLTNANEKGRLQMNNQYIVFLEHKYPSISDCSKVYGLEKYPQGESEVLSVLSTTTGSISFSDAPKGHQYYDAINWAQSNNIIEGYSDGTFKPDNTINRAEFVKVATLGLITNPPAVCDKDYTYTDVHDEWFEPYIQLASCNGLVSGYPDGTFKPANNINIAEAAKIIVSKHSIFRMKEALRPENPDSWYTPFMMYLHERQAFPKAIHNANNPLSQPYEAAGNFLTRGEMVEIMYRLSDEFRNQIFIKKPTPTPTTEIDLYFFTEDDFNTSTTASYHTNRTVFDTPKIADITLRSLFRGPIKEEEADGAYGLGSEFSAAYNSVVIHQSYPDIYDRNNNTQLQNVAIVDFDEDFSATFSPGASGTAMHIHIIEKALQQFASVDHVFFSFGGRVQSEWGA